MLRRPFCSLSIGVAALIVGGVHGCHRPDRTRQSAVTTKPAEDHSEASTQAASSKPSDGSAHSLSKKPLHERLLADALLVDEYEGIAENCLICHSGHADDLIKTVHWNWKGAVTDIEGLAGQVHGKRDLINNCCIGVSSNEGRCTACHPSYGWKSGTDESFFTDPANIDCLVCHDTTGKYRKHPTAGGGGGMAALLVDNTVVPVEPTDLTEIAYNVGKPTRANCGLCHFYAGGGDNVKHGDLSSDLIAPAAADDVHMGGENFSCQECHTESNHRIAGTTAMYGHEGEVSCTDCHDDTESHTEGDEQIAAVLNRHTERVACQTCHIPTFSRSQATKVEWYWDEAGEDRADSPTQFGKPTYSKGKGRFVWAKNVKPTYLWFDGKWKRMVVNALDTYSQAGTVADPVVVAAPTASIDNEDAKISPFKKLAGRQPADTVNKRLLVPHLFGDGPGPNPYWAKFEWDRSIAEGTAYSGQPYSGQYGFANTVAYFSINHEVAPKEAALRCNDCHGDEGFFKALGYDKDPSRD